MKKSPLLFFRWLVLSFIMLPALGIYAQAPVAAFSATPITGCAPLVVNFTDQSANSPKFWNWDFGNGSLSNQQNPTILYVTPGTYTVTLVVRNSDGTDGITKTDLIVVNPSPVASLSANITTGCVPVNIQFTDQSDPVAGTIVAWQWDFGDGNTSTLQNPSNNYTTTGFYSVLLKVTSSTGCTGAANYGRYIRIVPGVTADFNFSTPVTCQAPFAVNFTDQTSAPGNVTYQWDFGDGNTSTLQNPANNYAATGIFNVKLTALSDFGCSGTVQKPVTIVGTTTSFTSPDTACLNSPVNFVNGGIPPPVSSLWDFGNGLKSTKTNDVTSYGAPGTYKVKLINTYSICTDSFSKNVVVLPKPTVDFTANNLVSCKAPFTVTFQDLSPDAKAWQWNFGDGTFSTMQNPTHQYNAEGQYNVTLIITDSKGCSNSITKDSLIKIIKPAVSITNIPAGGCAPFTYPFTSNAIAIDGIASYSWDFGDGNTGAGPNPSHTYIATGTYTVTLTITTNGGCTVSSTVVGGIKVGNPPAVSFTASPLNTCVGSPINFTGVSATADAWSWNFGDGLTDNTQNPVHSYADSGFFSVRLTAFSNGCPSTATRINYIHINPPVAFFTYAVSCANKRLVTFTNKSKVNLAVYGPVTYSWDFGDGTTSNVVNPTHTYAGLGSYPVQLTVTEGGCSNTSGVTVNVVGDIADFSVSKSPACKNENVTVTAINSNPITTNYTWSINGSSFGGNTSSISTSFPTAGVNSVTLQITDANGCMDSKTVPNAIIVRGPTANFTVGSGGECGTSPVIFNDLSTPAGTITRWSWNFGDGQSQSFTSAPFTHLYSDTGNFTPALTVQDLNGCTDSFTLPTKVLITKSAAKFGSDFSTICPGVNVQFIDSSAGFGLSYLWDFGDGNTSTQQNPTHSFAPGNPYTVKLVIKDIAGCSDSITRASYITVKAPKPAFDIADTTTICPPIETFFTFHGQDYQSFFWDFGDGNTSTLTNPTHFYNSYGSFTAKLYLIGYGGCIDSASSVVNVYNPYTTTSLTYSPLTACNQLLVNFNITTTPSTHFYFYFGDGSSDTTQATTLQHLYGSPGFYAPNVFLTDNQGCQTTVGGPNTIRVIGSEPFFSEDRKAFCDSGTVFFTNFTIGNDPVVTRTWDFGDGSTSPVKDPFHTYTLPGTYLVSQSVTTQTGCSQTITDTIRVYGTPHPEIVGDTVVCINNVLALQGQLQVPDTAITWNWDLGNGSTANTQNTIATYPKNGNFTIRLTATNKLGCKSDTSKVILVPPTPVISIVADPTIIVGTGIVIPVTYSPNVATYLWTPSKALSCTDCPNPFANPKMTTKYNIKVSDIYGCEASRDVTVIVVCNGENYFIPNTFSPNGDGVNDIFAPRGKGIARINSMQIFNRWGQLVFEKKNFNANDRSPAGGWDGTFNGKPAAADVYVYMIEFVCENGAIIPYTGNVALIR